jgi:NAD(P)-dependent dehydrogenase (short-subunit alcohol dehydrogenase family)
VNAVAPGPIDTSGAAKQLWNSPEAVERITSRVPLRRWGTPAEVADAVAFLVSPMAAYITGDTITIDGGSRFGAGPYAFL